MTDLDTDDRARDRVDALARRLPVPGVSPDAVLRRARGAHRRQLFTRGAVAVGTVAALTAIVSVAVSNPPGAITAQPAAPPSGSPTGSSAPSASPTPEITELPMTDEAYAKKKAEERETWTDATDITPDEQAEIYAFGKKVEAILDPAGEHLGAVNVANFSRSPDAGFEEIGLSFEWRNPGQDGLGYVGVSIGIQPSAECDAFTAPGVDSFSDKPTECTKVEVDGVDATRARWADRDTVLTFARRADNYWLGVDLEQRNYKGPDIANKGITDAQVAALLTDTSLPMIGGVAALDPAQFLPGERIDAVAKDHVPGVRATSWSGQHEPALYDAKFGGADGGRLMMFAELKRSDEKMDAPCDAEVYTKCELRRAGDQQVRVSYGPEYADAKEGEQGEVIDVTVEGPLRLVTARSIAETDKQTLLPVDDLIELATDPRLQE